jgi:hypothetical protein
MMAILWRSAEPPLVGGISTGKACGRTAGRGITVCRAVRSLRETRWLARLLLVVFTTLVVFVALTLVWTAVVIETGGGGDECGGGSCGTLGDWDYENAGVRVVGTLAVALLTGVLFSCRFSWSRDAERPQ